MKEDEPPESAIWLHGSKGFGKDSQDIILGNTYSSMLTIHQGKQFLRHSLWMS